LLITPVPLTDGTPIRYAMGVTHYQHATGRVIEHGGGIDGFLSHSRYYPDEDVTVVVLQNTGAPPGPAEITDQIGEHLFGTPGIPAAQTLTGDLSRYEGIYSGPARGATLTVTVTRENDELNLLIFNNATFQAQTPTFIGANTFSVGNVRYIFELEEGASYSPVLRMDSPSSHYILRNLND